MTINLAPETCVKEGGFRFAHSLFVCLAAMGQMPGDKLRTFDCGGTRAFGRDQTDSGRFVDGYAGDEVGKEGSRASKEIGGGGLPSGRG